MSDGVFICVSCHVRSTFATCDPRILTSMSHTDYTQSLCPDDLPIEGTEAKCTSIYPIDLLFSFVSCLYCVVKTAEKTNTKQGPEKDNIPFYGPCVSLSFLVFLHSKQFSVWVANISDTGVRLVEL